MDSITPNLTKPLRFARARAFPGRIAEGVSQPPWSWHAGAGATLVAFAGFLGLSELFAAAARHRLPNLDRFWPTLIGALPMLGALACLTRQAGTTVGKVFGLRGARVGPVLVSSLLLLILELLLMAGAAILLPRLGFEKGPGAEVQTREALSSFFTLTDATVWAPLCEELWFRALLYTSLRTRFGVATSILASATLFAAVHYPETLVLTAALFFPAALSSLWYERTRSLWPNVIAHSLFNFLPCFVVLVSSTGQNLAR